MNFSEYPYLPRFNPNSIAYLVDHLELLGITLNVTVNQTMILSSDDPAFYLFQQTLLTRSWPDLPYFSMPLKLQ